MTRVRCISRRAYPGAPLDPDLELQRFYAVVDPEVYTIADETPYIKIRLPDGRNIDRPRHLFSPLLQRRKT